MKVDVLLTRVIAFVFIVVGINGLIYKDNVVFDSLFILFAVYIFIFVPKNGNDGDSGDFGDSDGGD